MAGGGLTAAYLLDFLLFVPAFEDLETLELTESLLCYYLRLDFIVAGYCTNFAYSSESPDRLLCYFTTILGLEGALAGFLLPPLLELGAAAT